MRIVMVFPLNGSIMKKAMRFTMKIVSALGLNSKYDEKGNRSYFENSKGYWAKWEYDEKRQ